MDGLEAIDALFIVKKVDALEATDHSHFRNSPLHLKRELSLTEQVIYELHQLTG